MTADTHDTAAALWSAIDAYGCDAASNGALGKDATTRAAIDRAITAHVEAEVARRLAAAPDVEDAIAELAGCSATSTACDEIRAAIVADEARAVSAAISPAVHELRNALPPVRHHAQRIEPGDRRDAILRGVDRALAVADELAAVLDGGPAVKARLAPDEAQRLVEEFERVAGIDYTGEHDHRAAARAALLAALTGKDHA